MSNRAKSMKRWGWKYGKMIILLAVIVIGVYWFKFSPIPVEGHQIEQGDIVVEVMGTGTLEARVTTTISPKISGRVETIHADQGDRVKADQLLVQLDDEELTQQVAVAQANVDAAKAATVRLGFDKEQSVAVAKRVREQHKRTVTLLANKTVSPETFEKSTESLAVAEAGLSRAEAAITEGQQILVAAEKTLEYHRARLNDTKIIAPFDGLIVQRQRDPGDVVVPGGAILTLISTEELWISAWVDETEIDKLTVDQKAKVIFRSEPDRSYQSVVVRLGQETDRETREFIVDVRVLELPKNWAVGQRAEVYINTAHKKDVTLIPAKFIFIEDDESGCYVNKNGHAMWRPLQFGVQNQNSIEVIKGLKKGETVVMPLDIKKNLTHKRAVTIP